MNSCCCAYGIHRHIHKSIYIHERAKTRALAQICHYFEMFENVGTHFWYRYSADDELVNPCIFSPTIDLVPNVQSNYRLKFGRQSVGFVRSFHLFQLHGMLGFSLNNWFEIPAANYLGQFTNKHTIFTMFNARWTRIINDWRAI